MGTLNIKSQSRPASSKISLTPAIINLTPGTITYDGTEKTQGVDNVIFLLTEGTDYILSGNTATNAGTHTITAVGTNGYKDATTVNWTIQKAASSITPSISSLKIEDLEDTGTFTITTTGDGTVSVSSSNTAVATVALSGNTVTVSPAGEGTATITVAISEGDNYNEASTEVSVDVDLTKVFGVVWNYGNSSTALTRLTPSTDPNGYVNTTILADPVPAVGTGSGSSQFDSYMPWKGMEEYNVANNAITYKKGDSNFSRSNTTVVYIPEFYYKIVKDTTNSKHYFYVADHAITGFEKHPGSGAYVGKYQLGSGYVCKTGVAPQVSMTRATARSSIKSNLGSKWSQWGLHHWNAIQLLYVVEFADWNSQSKIGQGRTNSNNSSVLSSGDTDAMVYHTGRNSGTDGYVAVQYRGIENLWGNVSQWVDGVNFNNRAIYYCTNPSKYADNTSTNYTSAGYSLPPTNYITQLGASSNANWMMLANATSVNSSNSIYISDYLYSAESWRVLVVGGNYINGLNAGLFYCDARGSSSGSYAAVGSRPIFIP